MKRVISAVLCALCVFALASCGKTQKEIDIDACAQYIAQNASFTEELQSVDSDYALEQFGLTSSQATVSYLSATTAVAEMVAVFKAGTANDIASVQSAVETKIDYLHTSYASYGAEEVSKIDSAVVLVEGNYVIFCISADNEGAKQIIEDYMN